MSPDNRRRVGLTSARSSHRSMTRSDQSGDRGIVTEAVTHPDDDHRASRSARRISTTMCRGALPPERLFTRSSTSSKVGVRASLDRRARTYSCKDIPASRARRRNVAWTSSGMSLTWILGIPRRYCPRVVTLAPRGTPTGRLTPLRSGRSPRHHVEKGSDAFKKRTEVVASVATRMSRSTDH